VDAHAHVSAAELLAFLRGFLGPPAARRALAHLAGCARCRQALGAALPTVPASAPPASGAGAAGHAGLSRPMAPGARRAGDRIGLLLAECGGLRRSDPWQALRLSALAREAALRLAPGHGDPVEATDWTALATAEMGNAHRLVGELDAAERCFRQALAIAERGSGRPRVVGTVADLAASLLADQRRFPEATGILARLHELYGLLGDRQLTARTLLALSVVESYAGEPERALPALLGALAGLDPAREPQLVALALHNLAKLLLDLGRPQAAGRVLSSAERAGRLSGAPLDRLRRRWLAGRIAAAAESYDPAAAAFRETMEGFAAAGLPYPAALAALDLATLQVQLGRRSEAHELLAGASGVFRRLGIAREALASLLLLRRLLATEAISTRALLGGFRRTAARLAELAARGSRRPPG
jgi:tetratricopeptide (TPR) repeat protein